MASPLDVEICRESRRLRLSATETASSYGDKQSFELLPERVRVQLGGTRHGDTSGRGVFDDVRCQGLGRRFRLVPDTWNMCRVIMTAPNTEDRGLTTSCGDRREGPHLSGYPGRRDVARGGDSHIGHQVPGASVAVRGGAPREYRLMPHSGKTATNCPLGLRTGAFVSEATSRAMPKPTIGQGKLRKYVSDDDMPKCKTAQGLVSAAPGAAPCRPNRVCLIALRV